MQWRLDSCGCHCGRPPYWNDNEAAPANTARNIGALLHYCKISILVASVRCWWHLHCNCCCFLDNNSFTVFIFNMEYALYVYISIVLLILASLTTGETMAYTSQCQIRSVHPQNGQNGIRRLFNAQLFIPLWRFLALENSHMKQIAVVARCLFNVGHIVVVPKGGCKVREETVTFQVILRWSVVSGAYSN